MKLYVRDMVQCRKNEQNEKIYHFYLTKNMNAVYTCDDTGVFANFIINTVYIRHFINNKCVCYMNLRRHCLLYTKFIVSNQSSIKKKKVQQISTIQYEVKELFLWKGEGAQAKRASVPPVVKLLN